MFRFSDFGKFDDEASCSGLAPNSTKIDVLAKFDVQNVVVRLFFRNYELLRDDPKQANLRLNWIGLRFSRFKTRMNNSIAMLKIMINAGYQEWLSRQLQVFDYFFRFWNLVN